jgi:hypothetical protein
LVFGTRGDADFGGRADLQGALGSGLIATSIARPEGGFLLSCFIQDLGQKRGNSVDRNIMKTVFFILAFGCLPVLGDVVGVEKIDDPDGSIGGLNEGFGWNYDRSTEFDENGVEPGPDSDASDWDILTGTPLES